MKVSAEALLDTWQSREPDADDDWDRGTTESSLREIIIYGTDSGRFNVKAQIGQEVYAVYVSYSTGDTFGHQSGQVDILDVFATYDEANALVDAVSKFNKADRTKKKFNPWSLTHNDKEYSVCWTGYFESFELCSVYPNRIRARY